MSKNLPKVTSPTDDAIRKIAMDVGKQVVAHIEWAYPEMFATAPKSAKMSIRNATYNAIIAAVNAADKGQDVQQIATNEAHRKEIRRLKKLHADFDAGKISGDEVLEKLRAANARTTQAE